MNHEEIEVRYI